MLLGWGSYAQNPQSITLICNNIMFCSFKLGCLAVTCTAVATGTETSDVALRKEEIPPKEGIPPKEESLQKSPHDLNSFFGASHHPLSFSYFDATAQSAPTAPKPEAQARAVAAPSAAESSSNGPSVNVIPSLDKIPSGNESPFGVMPGTTMDTIQQAIRDLKLTIAEMDEKLDRVVQKVAPEGKVSMMRQGTEMFRKIFRFPPSRTPDPLKTANERGYGFGGGSDGYQRGIGLSW